MSRGVELKKTIYYRKRDEIFEKEKMLIFTCTKVR